MADEKRTKHGTSGTESAEAKQGADRGGSPPEGSIGPGHVGQVENDPTFLDDSDLPVCLPADGPSTETIDLNTLFKKDITDSGSFDIRGEIWKTTFGRVIQALPIVALLVDEGLSVTAANEACRGISPGYGDILGKPFVGLYPTGSEKSKARSVIQSVFADRRPRVFFGMLAISGKMIWGRATLRSIRIMSERFVLVLIENLTRETEQLILNEKHQEALRKEIAERKLSEEALKCSEARFRRLYDGAPLMMLSLDRDGTIRSVNAKCLQDLGYSPGELADRNVSVLLNDGNRETFLHTLNRLWNTGEIRDCPAGCLKKNCVPMEALIDGVTVEDPAWGAVGLLTVRDVTNELLLEKQLRESQKMEALGTLAGGVAHDFNNLLQIIHGYAELVMMKLKKESPGYQGLRTIRDTARRGSDLVKQILAFSRKVESNFRPLDLNHEVLKSSRLLERTVPKMIGIRLNLEESLHTVSADPVQIEQIVLNLAVNAKDAMPEGGRLTIETGNVSFDQTHCSRSPEMRPGDYVCLAVSDTGHGMERDVLAHIFEPFFTTKRPGDGTGLGLSTVFGLVKIHGGHITCESAPGKGTDIRIYLPAIGLQVGRRLEATGEMPAFGTETILFVDDEGLVRAWAKEILAGAGYTVVEAANGRDALQVYSERCDEVSLVILDLVMPEMGGKHCLQELRRINPNVKAIVSSGYPMDRGTAEFLQQHAKATIAKPFQAKELFGMVRRVI
ncbi:MAG: ATP-binding protein, partial [Pseudomonadota bacterium]